MVWWTNIFNYFWQVIRQRKESRKTKTDENANEPEEGVKRRLAFLDILLDIAEENKAMSDLEIREEVDVFMYAVSNKS